MRGEFYPPLSAYFLYWTPEPCSPMDRLIAASAFKPRAGSIWSVPKFVLDLLIWFWLFCWTFDGDLRVLVGLEVVLRTSWTEGCFVWWWEGFLTLRRTARLLASASINIFITLLPAVVWVATCIYFAWSPELARIGFCVVFVFSGWISLFTHALGPRVSVGTAGARAFGRGCGGQQEGLYGRVCAKQRHERVGDGDRRYALISI